jgi:hypothetical protein
MDKVRGLKISSLVLGGKKKETIEEVKSGDFRDSNKSA